MTCLRSTRPRDFASRRYYLHYLFIPGKETATTLEMFSSSRTVRLVVRESEEMGVRVMWKSDSNETRYNGRSAQGLNSQEKIWLSFIHGNSRQHGIWTVLGEEKRNFEMMGADLKRSFAFAFAFADCQVKSTPFLLQSSKDTVSTRPHAPAPVYITCLPVDLLASWEGFVFQSGDLPGEQSRTTIAQAQIQTQRAYESKIAP